MGDSTCLDYYLTLGERPSATAVNSAATAICASQRCKNRMSSYIDVLKYCRVDNILDDDDDDDDDVSSTHNNELTGHTYMYCYMLCIFQLIQYLL